MVSGDWNDFAIKTLLLTISLSSETSERYRRWKSSTPLAQRVMLRTLRTLDLLSIFIRHFLRHFIIQKITHPPPLRAESMNLDHLCSRQYRKYRVDAILSTQMRGNAPKEDHSEIGDPML
ncbi:hypothetical protein Tco_1184672 [Tanacetum coccineum]